MDLSSASVLYDLHVAAVDDQIQTIHVALRSARSVVAILEDQLADARLRAKSVREMIAFEKARDARDAASALGRLRESYTATHDVRFLKESRCNRGITTFHWVIGTIESAETGAWIDFLMTESRRIANFKKDLPKYTVQQADGTLREIYKYATHRVRPASKPILPSATVAEKYRLHELPTGFIATDAMSLHSWLHMAETYYKAMSDYMARYAAAWQEQDALDSATHDDLWNM